MFNIRSSTPAPARSSTSASHPGARTSGSSGLGSAIQNIWPRRVTFSAPSNARSRPAESQPLAEIALEVLGNAERDPRRKKLKDASENFSTFKKREFKPGEWVEFHRTQELYMHRASARKGQIRDAEANVPSLDELTTQYMHAAGMSDDDIKNARKSWGYSSVCYALGPFLMNAASTSSAATMLGTSPESLQANLYENRKLYFGITLGLALATSFVNAITQLYFVALQELVADRQSNRIKALAAPTYPTLTPQLNDNTAEMEKLAAALEIVESKAQCVLAVGGNDAAQNKAFMDEFTYLLARKLRPLLSPEDQEALDRAITDAKFLLPETQDASQPDESAHDISASFRNSVVTLLNSSVRQAEMKLGEHTKLVKAFERRRNVIGLNFKGQTAQSIVRAGVAAATFLSLVLARHLISHPHTLYWGQILARVTGMLLQFWAANRDVHAKFTATFEAAAQGIDVLKPGVAEARQAGNSGAIGPDDIDIERIKKDEPVRLGVAAALTQVREQLKAERADRMNAVTGGICDAEREELRAGVIRLSSLSASGLNEVKAIADGLQQSSPTETAFPPLTQDEKNSLLQLRSRSADTANPLSEEDTSTLTDLETRRMQEIARHYLNEGEKKLLDADAEAARLDLDFKLLDSDDWHKMSEKSIEIMELALSEKPSARLRMAARTMITRFRQTSEFVPQLAQRIGSAHPMGVLGVNSMLATSGGLALENAKRLRDGKPVINPVILTTVGAVQALGTISVTLLSGYGINNKISARAAARKNTDPAFTRNAWFKFETIPYAVRTAGKAMIAVPIGLIEARQVRNARDKGASASARLDSVQHKHSDLIKRLS